MRSDDRFLAKQKFFIKRFQHRTASPISGAMVVVSGIAMVNPLEVSKRTFVPSLVALIALALTIVYSHLTGEPTLRLTSYFS